MEQGTPAATSRGSGWSSGRLDDAGAEVRDGAHVEDDSPLGELRDEVGVLDGPDAVADAVGPEDVQRTADGRGARRLAGVGDGPEPALARARERSRELLGCIEGFLAAEAHSDNAPIGVRQAVVHCHLGVLDGRAARDVGREPHLHVVLLTRLLCAVAVAAEDLVPPDAPPRALDRREDRLQVDGPVRCGLRRVLDRDAPEVVRAAQAVGGQDPDLDEVVEVPEAIELRQLRFGGRGELEPVRARERKQRRRPDRPLEVDVQLDLGRRWHGGSLRRGSGRP